VPAASAVLQLIIFNVFIILGHHNVHKGPRTHHGDKYSKYNGKSGYS